MRTALQQAVYDLLTAGGGLVVAGIGPSGGALTVAVLDNVPQGTATPYVTIGEDNLEGGPARTDDSEGAEGIVEITIYTGLEHSGRKTAKLIADAVQARLNLAKPSVSGYTLAALFWDSSANFDEVDGLTRRTVEGYRALLQE